MRIPAIRGVIDRRILVNYRVAPEALAAVLPAPFRPHTIDGCGIAGICLIRLKHVRPRFLPRWCGFASANAAHRIAVEWDADGGVRQGVYIPRRDTDSRLTALVGGRLFPGRHHLATFRVRDTPDRLTIEFCSHDGGASAAVRGRATRRFPASSAFGSLARASEFFEAGSLGYSATAQSGRFDGLELRCPDWRVVPLEIEEVRSSFFDDAARFPPGTVAFDCALLMRGIVHEWHRRPDLRQSRM
jgi:Uncharacterized conserved protein (COG2071)